MIFKLFIQLLAILLVALTMSNTFERNLDSELDGAVDTASYLEALANRNYIPELEERRPQLADLFRTIHQEAAAVDEDALDLAEDSDQEDW